MNTAYRIWSVISSISNLNRSSSSLSLFCHVPLKRDQWDWDWRLRLNDTPDAIGCTVTRSNQWQKKKTYSCIPSHGAIPPKKILGCGFSTPYTLFGLICTINSELNHFPSKSNVSDLGSISASLSGRVRYPLDSKRIFVQTNMNISYCHVAHVRTSHSHATHMHIVHETWHCARCHKCDMQTRMCNKCHELTMPLNQYLSRTYNSTRGVGCLKLQGGEDP